MLKSFSNPSFSTMEVEDDSHVNINIREMVHTNSEHKPGTGITHALVGLDLIMEHQ